MPWVVAVLLRAIGATLRFEDVCEPGVVPPTEASKGIYCFWHRCALPSLIYFRGKLRCSILVSQSFDGELIARTIRHFGFDAVRGSSSREGAAGLLGLKRVVDAGSVAVFTGDGPRGPLYQAKIGAVKLAQMTDAVIGSIYLLPERAWVVKSWDSFLVPKPFSRVAVSWARKVVAPPRDADLISLEETRIEVQAALERARLLAEEHFLVSS